MNAPNLSSLNSSESAAPKWHWLVITFAFLISAGWNLHIQTISNPDEPRYAAAAREIARGGDLLVPIFNGEPRLQKPIFYYWATSGTGWVGERLGLPMDFTFRLVPLLMGLATVWATYLLGRRFLGGTGALVSAIVLITANMFHNLSRELLSDMTLTAFLTWTWVFFFAALERQQTGRGSMHLLVLAYFSAGLANLTKGPILLLVFVLAPILVWSIWTRRAEPRLRSGWWWGAPVALMCGLWWYLALVKVGQHGFFLDSDNMQRFAASKGHEHPVPFVYYVINLFESFAPWSVLLPAGVWWTVSKFRRGELSFSKTQKLVLCLTVIPFVILSVAPAKRHLYLLPLYPFLAIWMGWLYGEARAALEQQRLSWKWVHAVFAVSIVVAAGLCAAPFWIGKLGGSSKESIFGVALGVGILGLSLQALKFARQISFSSVIACGLAIALLLSVGFEGTVRPIRERKLALRPFYADVQKYAKGGYVMFNGLNSNEAVWYLDQNDQRLDEVSLAEMPSEFFGKPGRLMLIPVATLLKGPLEGTVERLSPVMTRYGEDFVLVNPKPGAALTKEQLEAFQSKNDAGTSKRAHSILHGM